MREGVEKREADSLICEICCVVAQRIIKPQIIQMGLSLESVLELLIRSAYTDDWEV